MFSIWRNWQNNIKTDQINTSLMEAARSSEKLETSTRLHGAKTQKAAIWS